MQSIIQCILCTRQLIVCGFRYCWLGSRPPGSREGAGSDVDQCVVTDAAHQEAAVVRASVCESTPECFTVSNLSARLYALLQLSRLPFQGGHSPEYLLQNGSPVLVVKFSSIGNMELFDIISLSKNKHSSIYFFPQFRNKYKIPF